MKGSAHITEIDGNDNIVDSVKIDLESPRMLHDFIITEN